MTIGQKIAQCRKQQGLTQDALAQKLGVTNQAVSKWESEQSCPDILLLPRIADIFGLTMDELFARELSPEKVKAQYETIFGTAAEPETQPKSQPVRPEPELPWADDGVLRVVLYAGHTYVGSCPEQEKITFEYEGPALNIECAVNIACGDVEGDVRSGGNINCDAVNGNVQCDGNVACDAVEGHVNARGSVTCDDVNGNISAGGNVTCDDVDGSVYAGGNVICDEISGSATAGGRVSCEGGNGVSRFGGSVVPSPEEEQEDCGKSSCEGDCMTCEKNNFTFSFGGKNGKPEKDGKKKKGFSFWL